MGLAVIGGDGEATTDREELVGGARGYTKGRFLTLHRGLDSHLFVLFYFPQINSKR